MQGDSQPGCSPPIPNWLEEPFQLVTRFKNSSNVRSADALHSSQALGGPGQQPLPIPASKQLPVGFGRPSRFQPLADQEESESEQWQGDGWVNTKADFTGRWERSIVVPLSYPQQEVLPSGVQRQAVRPSRLCRASSPLGSAAGSR